MAANYAAGLDLMGAAGAFRLDHASAYAQLRLPASAALGRLYSGCHDTSFRVFGAVWSGWASGAEVELTA
jgi:hypothetical protein